MVQKATCFHPNLRQNVVQSQSDVSMAMRVCGYAKDWSIVFIFIFQLCMYNCRLQREMYLLIKLYPGWTDYTSS